MGAYWLEALATVFDFFDETEWTQRNLPSSENKDLECTRFEWVAGVRDVFHVIKPPSQPTTMKSSPSGAGLTWELITAVNIGLFPTQKSNLLTYYPVSCCHSCRFQFLISDDVKRSVYSASHCNTFGPVNLQLSLMITAKLLDLKSLNLNDTPNVSQL